jgi:hypothetical protein
MGRTKGPYRPEYSEGETVRIVSLDKLENFIKAWKFHNKLQPDQLGYAGRLARVESIGFYHGGDELYRLKELPGIWHEICLERVQE